MRDLRDICSTSYRSMTRVKEQWARPVFPGDCVALLLETQPTWCLKLGQELPIKCLRAAHLLCCNSNMSRNVGSSIFATILVVDPRLVYSARLVPQLAITRLVGRMALPHQVNFRSRLCSCYSTGQSSPPSSLARPGLTGLSMATEASFDRITVIEALSARCTH